MVQNAAQKISVAIPRMPDADMVLPYLRRIDAARYYSNFGPLVREFEARVGAGYGVEPACVTSVASGTAALTLALRASAPTPGSLCMMPSWTFRPPRMRRAKPASHPISSMWHATAGR